jgi:hypothetical protein
MSASSVKDCEVNLQFIQTKDYKIDKMSKRKDWFIKSQDKCQSGMACLPVDCLFQWAKTI